MDDFIKQCMIAAMQMVLEEATENAQLEIKDEEGVHKNNKFYAEDSSDAIVTVNKQSIIDTINKYL